jgi:hypothetical protein
MSGYWSRLTFGVVSQSVGLTLTSSEAASLTDALLWLFYPTPARRFYQFTAVDEATRYRVLRIYTHSRFPMRSRSSMKAAFFAPSASIPWICGSGDSMARTAGVERVIASARARSARA